MQKLPTKLLIGTFAGLLLTACAQNFPRRDELPSAVFGHLEGQQVLLKVSFEASEDTSFQCASKLVLEQANPSALDEVVRTDRPEANRAVSFSKKLVFQGDQLDGCAGDSDGQTALGDSRHEAVARAGPEPGADVQT